MQKTESDPSNRFNNLSVRAYLDQTVVPLLLKGLVEVSNQRCLNQTGQPHRILG